MGFGKTQNISAGNGICVLPRKRGSPKFGHRMRDFFPCLSGIREIMTTQEHVLAANATQQGVRSVCLLSTEQTIYSDLVNDCLTETFK